MKWSGRLTDKYYSVVWGINFPEIADKYNMPRDKVDEIFQHYRTTFSRGSFTRDEFKTNRLKLKKDDDLQLDGVCESFFKKYDKENTGEIKFANYVEMLNVQFYGTVEQKLALLFELIDQDGNKYISERELADMLTATFHMKGKSEPRTKAEALASRIFSVAHQDIAGQLTLDQFKCVAHEQSLFSDIYELFHPDFDTSTREKEEPPVHWMVRINDYKKCLRLLMNGNDPNWKNKNGNTALHIAVQDTECRLMKMLIVFGADVNMKNNNGCTPRHLAANLAVEPTKKQRILELLVSVGATRCPPGMEGCAADCRCEDAGEDCVGGSFGMPANNDGRYFLCFGRDSESVFNNRKIQSTIDCITPDIGDMVLCLDGGGIRGLILTQILLEIERILRDEFKSKLTIRECFDWIGGTSTGGILALAIARGIKIEDCRKLYFEMKENVFEKSDSKFHASELVELLKIKFGEEVKLAELSSQSPDEHAPKVLVTTVRTGKKSGTPGKLNLLRTYSRSMMSGSIDSTDGGALDETDDANAIIQDVWEAAQATGAAPYYFPAVRDIFVDGGMMANNPTLDVLTEIVRYREEHQQYDISVGAVMSLGTGNAPPQDLLENHPILKGLISNIGVIQNFKDFFQLILNEVTNTKDTKETRSEAWCKSIHADFFRINPPLDKFVDLSCTEDKQLIGMLYSTKVYLFKHQEKLKEAAGLLLARHKQRISNNNKLASEDS